MNDWMVKLLNFVNNMNSYPFTKFTLLRVLYHYGVFCDIYVDKILVKY